MRYIHIILLALFSIFAQGQIQDSGGHGLMLLNTKENEDMKKVKGSPYLNEDFTSGKLFITGKEPLDVFLRYDVAKDIIEIKINKASAETYVLPLGQKAEYIIGQDTFVYESLNSSGTKINGYFVELFKGENIRLLKKHSASVSQAEKAKTGYEKDRPAEIKINDQYYVLFRNGELKPIDLKEKDLKKALPDSKEVKNYLDSNKLKSVEDFKTFFKWYDTQL